MAESIYALIDINPRNPADARKYPPSTPVYCKLVRQLAPVIAPACYIKA